MAFFVPLTDPEQLPSKGAAIERAVMDWKAVDDSTPFHKAKDVAAFANHLGGTLLIGAHEADGHLRSYAGLDPADAGKTRAAYSSAVEQRCRPRPVFDFEEYAVPDNASKVVVVVNVWPSLLLVGVKIEAHKPTEGFGGPSFVYPVRSGSDATYLEPNQIAMYMTPHVRRIAVLLSRIPRGAVIAIKSPVGFHYTEYTARLDEVLETENVATFLDPDGVKPMRRIPLDRITTVFEDWDADKKVNVWRLYVEYWNTPPPPNPRPG